MKKKFLTMDNREPLTAEQYVEAQAELKKIAMSANRKELIAETLRDVYDPEMPVPEIVADLGFEMKSAEPGEHVFYNSPRSNDKKVLTITSGCAVTHVRRTPATRAELSFTTLVSEDYYVCIQDILQGDHNALVEAGDDIIESLNRQEVYALLQLLDAGAVANGNVFTLDSGDTQLDVPKFYAMKKAIRKYGKNLVFVTGINVTEDVDLSDYNEDKRREKTIKQMLDKHIPIENLEVYINGVKKEVIADDVGYLVAVSDAKRNKPGLMARRKISASMASLALDTTIVNKERAIVFTGLQKSVDAVDNWALGYGGLEEYGAVLINSLTVAKFTRS